MTASVLTQPYVQGLQPAAVCPLYDPRCERRDRARLLREDVPEPAYTNAYYSVAGRWPDVGWVLLRRGDYNNLNVYATNLTLTLDDLDPATAPVVIPNLAVVQARCVSRGSAADPNAIYLVQLTNLQGVAYNTWFQFPTTSQYNVVAPAYPGQYYATTTNGGVPWTWATLLQNLWQQMGTFLGPWPGLPAGFLPQGTPQNFVFTGTPAWEALNRVLDLLGLVVAENPQSALAPFTLAVSGAADSAFVQLSLQYASRLEEDREWLDGGAARAPATVVVLFHRANQYYGTEETVRADALQWQAAPLYEVVVAGPGPFNRGVGVGYLWDDFVVRFDVNGNPLTPDVAAAAAIAADRVGQYYNRVFRAGFMKQVYSGVVPFVTGSQVDGVRWFQDFRGIRGEEARAGWRTEILRGLVWDEVQFSLNAKGLQGK